MLRTFPVCIEPTDRGEVANNRLGSLKVSVIGDLLQQELITLDNNMGGDRR